LLAAWRGLDQFRERASVRAWLYRIATNRSLDALRANRRRPQQQQMPQLPEPTRWNEPVWLEPYPDAMLEGIADDAPGPEARYETKEAIALAFIVGLQHLPSQQGRCSCCATCWATAPGRSPTYSRPPRRRSTTCCGARVRRSNPAYERADANERHCRTPNLERDVVVAEAVENGDIDAMVALLTKDAWLTMPPLPHAYQGHTAIEIHEAVGGRHQRGRGRAR
jgi:RNA polymerase sigma-70 factor (ECF subfamily)